MAVDAEDRAWFKQVVEEAFKATAIANDERCKRIVASAMEQHKKDAITHNPVKAITTGTALIGIIEWLRSLIKH